MIVKSPENRRLFVDFVFMWLYNITIKKRGKKNEYQV